MITDKVRAAATIGAAITLTVNVDAASLSPAEAAVTTVVSQRSHSPVGNSVPPLPPTTLLPIPDATITPPSLGGLFPTVTPLASPAAKQKHQQSRKADRIAQTSSALPLDPRLIGGQLAGLAVLAAAITMVVARLSLRTAQPANPGPAGPPAKADSSGDAEDSSPTT